MIRIYKHVGETPLEALQRFRTDYPGYNDTRLSYAGRLDPMAEGELLVLEGEENDRRGEFLGVDKTYEFQVLFGYATDSFDLLGLPQTDTGNTFNSKFYRKDKLTRRLTVICEDLKGSWSMRYPPYSSKTVEHEGKQTPLWQLARSGDLPDC
jgi:tRNA U55 pseudouridine synthase TruB